MNLSPVIPTARERVWRRVIAGGPGWRSAVVDATLLLAILLLVDAVFAWPSLGWFDLNPCPYLLVPSLIGARYGFFPGLISGFATALIVSGAAVATGGKSWAALWDAQAFLLLSMPIVGGVFGDVQAFFKRDVKRLELLGAEASIRMRRLDEEVYLLRTAKDQLERTLATVDANVSSLDFEIRRLFQASGDAVFEGLLGILSRCVRVAEAGLYVPPQKPGQGWTRAALMGSGRWLPPVLHPLEHALTRTAVTERDLATLPDLLAEAGPGPEPEKDFLIASPLLTLDREIIGLLVVSDLPFVAMNRQTVHMVSIVCRWAARFLAMKSAHASGRARMLHGSTRTMICYGHQITPALSLVWETWRTLRITSCVLVLRQSAGREGAPQDQDAFEVAIGPLLRGSDILAWREGEQAPHIVVVLPLTGERGGRICLDRVLQSPGVSGDLVSLTDCQSLKDLEQRVDRLIRGLSQQEARG
jgi:hypothetical protein